MTKFLNISTDDTLGGNSPSDEVVSSQKAIKTNKYIIKYISNLHKTTPFVHLVYHNNIL